VPPRQGYTEEEEEEEYEDRRRIRRDLEPHRGALVLVLGILSIAALVFYLCCFIPVSPIVGAFAWILGHQDLRKMKEGRMDPDGQGLTSAGWICGMIGTVLGILVAVGYCGIVGLAFLSASGLTAK
jgi:hypothetical protein